MKKNLWVLLALSALIAMFVIAGCAPKPTTPTPTPTPTASPTTPPADTAAPELVSTEVFKYYGALDYSCGSCVSCPDFTWQSTSSTLYGNCTCDDYVLDKQVGSGSPNFKIVITFNENIDTLVSSCVYNPANWTIQVKNAGRVSKEISNLPTSSGGIVAVNNVEINGKQIIVTAAVVEYGTLALTPAYGQTYNNDFIFCGLICSSDDADIYAQVVNGPFYPFSYAKAAPTVADEICWELSSTCVISDELGNVNCGYKGCDCCLEATCTTCVDECPFGDPVCPTCVNPCE